ncbi:hypothetical protein BpHYR1_051699 [Brachionus plicatilis]|uniref:Uncharacterized protein n=1 Tax=Brachionus plicatilis TaxID=10195 RepID=A0A3M7T0I9_BRAPC|nr:hypothetical protein BpHYR1_051699 [Brachionus plicatilis]
MKKISSLKVKHLFHVSRSILKIRPNCHPNILDEILVDQHDYQIALSHNIYSFTHKTKSE